MPSHPWPRCSDKAPSSWSVACQLWESPAVASLRTACPPWAGTALSELPVGEDRSGGKEKCQLFSEQGTLEICH